MIDLNKLTKETLITIILDYDANNVPTYSDLEFLDLQRDFIDLQGLYHDEIQKKLYWKNKFLELQPKVNNRKIVEYKDTKIYQKDHKPNEKNAGYKVKGDAGKAGNVKGSKHSGHLNKDELFKVTFKDGTFKTFESVNFAKKYIWKHVPELKKSPLTNISAAGRRSGSYRNSNGYAYGLRFEYIKKEMN